MEAWRKLSEGVVHDRFRRIVNREFRLPDGTTGDFEVADVSDSAAVLALTPSRDIVLVREFRPGPEEVLLGLPGGVVEPGQSPVEAARAELLDETGYEGDLVDVGSVLANPYATNTKFVFAATGCRKSAEPANPALTEPVLVALSDFRSHLRGGRLTDTDAAYRALEHLGLL